MKKNNTLVFIILALIVFGVIYLVISLTQNVGKNEATVNMESSIRKLNDLYKDINPKEQTVQRSNAITSNEAIAVLPDISEYPFIVNPTTDNFITIYASTDIANTDEISWLRQAGENFNKNNITEDGVPISVGIRAIPSNLAADFITTGKYTPDIYIPTSNIYGEMLQSSEKKSNLITEKVVGNVSGIVINSRYKDETASNIINKVLSGNCIVGYTNPLSNEDGLNFLLTLLNEFDNKAPLGASAVEKLKIYQDKIPYVSYDILQLQDSLQNGTIDGFASNYQTYYNTPALRNSYEFIPFGVRQDHPAYEIGELSNIKRKIAQKFLEYIKSDNAQKIASNVGFNVFADYTYSGYNYTGNEIADSQNIWKKEKNGSSDLTAVFVADVSGSMEGSPLLKLKASLNRASTFIDENTNIGLVTFSDTVNIALPIAKFDNTQKAYFSNSVKSMRAVGGTAMFDAIAVAERMLVEAQQKNPNTRLMLFVLTDGESNRGHEFEDIEEITRGLRIPIYTIGYNADIDVLEAVSNINEASTMDADSDNVIYKLESLFNAQM